MKTITLLTAAMLVTPLAAQLSNQTGEARIQVHGEFMSPRQVKLFPIGTNEFKDQAENQIGFGIRLLGEVPGLNNWYYTVGAKLESSSKFATKPTTANGDSDTTGIKFKYSYWTVGAGYMWSLAPGLNLGTHLEVRGEALKVSGVFRTTLVPPPSTTDGWPFDSSATFVRPWGRLSLDYAFKAAGTSPFIGVDVSMAMLKASQDKYLAETLLLDGGKVITDDNTVKSMAPQVSFSVYFGIKF